MNESDQEVLIQGKLDVDDICYKVSDEEHQPTWQRAEDKGSNNAFSGFLRRNAVSEGCSTEKSSEEETPIICLPRKTEEDCNITGPKAMFKSWILILTQGSRIDSRMLLTLTQIGVRKLQEGDLCM
jgi:hypothetical protein